MTTWVEHLAREDRAWIVYATIQGIGDSLGLWRFSTAEGWALLSGQGSWRPWLSELPDFLSERVPYLEGGAVRSEGSVDLSIVDEGEALTDLLALDQGRVASLTALSDTTDTTFALDAVPSGLQGGDMLWLGSEAVRVSSAAANPITVIRGELGTTPRTHVTGAPVFARPQLVQHREVRLYIAPLDGAESEAQLVGVYTLDRLGLHETTASWEISATVREPYLDRRCPRKPIEREVTYSLETEELGRFAVAANGSSPEGPLGGGALVVYGHSDLDELMAYQEAGTTIRTGESLGDVRARAGTALDDLPEVGQVLRRVLTVENGDFRATGITNATTDRSSTTAWQPVDSWVEILLCLLLSPAVEGQGADNFNPSGAGWDGRNFSGLPAGYGVGVPYTEVNFADFEEIAASQANFPLRNLALGLEDRTFSEVATEFLKPSGCVLVRERGIIRLIAPGPVLQSDTAPATLDVDTVLMRGSLPDIEVERTETSSIVEVLATYGPQEREIQVTWADRREFFDPEDLYQFDGQALELEVPGLAGRDEEALRYLCLRHLRRGYRPLTDVRVEADAQVWPWTLGGPVAVDLPAIPNFTGSRGIQGTGQLAESELRMSEREGAYVFGRVLVSEAIAVGRISASALVTSANGNIAFVADNVYTETDALEGLPNVDRDAFTAGDVVRLIGANGADIGGGTETVTATGATALSYDISLNVTNPEAEVLDGGATLRIIHEETSGTSLEYNIARVTAANPISAPFTLQWRAFSAPWFVGLNPTQVPFADPAPDCEIGVGTYITDQLYYFEGPYVDFGTSYQGPLGLPAVGALFQLTVDAAGNLAFTVNGGNWLNSTGHTNGPYYVHFGWGEGASNDLEETEFSDISGLSTGGTIELSGNFGGNLGAGILIHADASAVTARQAGRYVFHDRDWQLG